MSPLTLKCESSLKWMALSTIQFRNNEEVGHKEKNPDDGKEKGVSKERLNIHSIPVF